VYINEVGEASEKMKWGEVKVKRDKKSKVKHNKVAPCNGWGTVREGGHTIE